MPDRNHGPHQDGQGNGNIVVQDNLTSRGAWPAKQMELRNLTPFSVHLFRGVVDDDTMVAVVACRFTCSVQRDGGLVPLEVQEPVRANAEELPEGIFDDDSAPLKPGVEVVVLGDALPVPGPTATRMTVRLLVGEAAREISVVGDRVWEPALGVDRDEAVSRSRAGHHDLDALRSSAPEPFERMPVTWERAFGGVAEQYDEDGFAGLLPHPENTGGAGYYAYLEQALGSALPNLEGPAAVSHWRQRPRPMGLSPLGPMTKVRVARGYDADHEQGTVEVLPQSYLSAPPEQCFEDLEPGTQVEVRGMSPSGSLHFAIPDLPVEVDVQTGPRRSRLPCRLDTVELHPNEERVAFVLRAAFQYEVLAGEERMVVITLTDKPRLS